MSFKPLIVSLMIMTATTVNAELVSADWQAVNDNKIVLDTDTGIEWLKLSETEGVFPSDFTTLSDSGGIYEGWTIANSDQITAFFYNAFPVMQTNTLEQNGRFIPSGMDIQATSEQAIIFAALISNNGHTKSPSGGLRDYAYGFYQGNDGELDIMGTTFAEDGDSPILYNGYDIPSPDPLLIRLFLVRDLNNANITSNVDSPVLVGIVTLLTMLSFRRKML